MWVKSYGLKMNLPRGLKLGSVIPTNSIFLHKLYRSTLRFEQGFYLFSTQKLSGYYDYLYIYRSTSTTNLSLLWGAS